MPEGRTLQLLFGDFDVETSPACSNGSLAISDKKGELKMGMLTQKGIPNFPVVDIFPAVSSHSKLAVQLTLKTMLVFPQTDIVQCAGSGGALRV